MEVRGARYILLRGKLTFDIIAKFVSRRTDDVDEAWAAAESHCGGQSSNVMPQNADIT